MNTFSSGHADTNGIRFETTLNNNYQVQQKEKNCIPIKEIEHGQELNETAGGCDQRNKTLFAVLLSQNDRKKLRYLLEIVI